MSDTGFDRRLIHLDASDNVCAAATQLAPGTRLLARGVEIEILEDIPRGHKVAIEPIDTGAKIRKYGAIIGSATVPIEPGRRVHTHNLASDYLPTYRRGEAADAIEGLRAISIARLHGWCVGGGSDTALCG